MSTSSPPPHQLNTLPLSTGIGPIHPLSGTGDNDNHINFDQAGPSRQMQSSTTQTTLAPTLNGTAKFDRFESPAGAFPTSRSEGWDEAWERQQRERWRVKVEEDLRGWRGGNGEPRSGYSKEAVPTNSYYGQSVTGTIGVHLPKEIIRIERDWSEGEVCQFETSFPMELEGRVTPNQWKDFINEINIRMVEAYSVQGAVIDNLIAIATWWTSLLWRTSHFETHLRLVEKDIDRANKDLFEPAGLRVLSPRSMALQFMEIESVVDGIYDGRTNQTGIINYQDDKHGI